MSPIQSRVHPLRCDATTKRSKRKRNSCLGATTGRREGT